MSARPERRPALPGLAPIDAAARQGRFQLVFGGDAEFACARWDGAGWVFSSGHPLHFEPESYALTGGIRP